MIDGPLNRTLIKRALQEISLRVQDRFSELDDRVAELIKFNKLHEEYVHVQVTRGVGERAFTYDDILTPTVILSINSS
ncbi:hypothetical protein IVB30_32555 [Bradyrhizobium sp. 200]|uniref:hypothetical protein n=1 Tax=Bradyrhizobium sp. 200 TaxID=2782665 RepID=UPI001FFE8C13|nr:hypothetical protein [Bradyrhizobium sp. 200]UPJ47885.1 hypothetical protein IVB30_32555 [Bradyrhizobium sp. 200]